MKRFLIKFCLLFAIILGLIGYYTWVVRSELSGDMGSIGKIPFGHAYDERIERPYQDMDLRVKTIHISADIPDSVITIGDSFSHLGKYAYNNFLANRLDCGVSNITSSIWVPEQSFVRLVNNGKIPKNAIVIVESVEREVIGRLANLHFDDSAVEPAPEVRQQGSQRVDLLSETMIWIRTTLGVKQPIKKYHITRELFSHETRHKELYIYDSRWNDTGDLRFLKKLTESNVVKAWENLYRLHQFAEEHGIRMIYVIAADKYDMYEPFIVEEHPKNPTLDDCPDESWIINTKTLLQPKAEADAKDIYSINDTHWSPIGAEMVAEEIMQRIKVCNDCEN